MRILAPCGIQIILLNKIIIKAKSYKALIYFLRSISLLQSVKTVQLPTEKFIEMIFGDPKIMSAGLRLLALFLKGFISKMPLFIRISSPTTIELRSLYIHIHMICAQVY